MIRDDLCRGEITVQSFMGVNAKRALLSTLLIASLATTVCAQRSTEGVLADKVDSWTINATSDSKLAEYLVILNAQADLSPAAHRKTKLEKGRFVRTTLFDLAQSTQAPLRRWLEERGVEHRPFYIVNMLWVKSGRDTLKAIAERPEVRSIEGNPRTFGLVHNPSRLTHAPQPRTQAEGSTLVIEPGIAYTNADHVWALGHTGLGVVIGAQDTGYEWTHAAVMSNYRGWNGTTANHDYNWHDSIHSGGGSCGSDSPFPCDDNNHGTHTLGTACGDDGAGNQIGMAPGAQWIASRNMDRGNGTPATYIESFEWFLAPYPVGGNPSQGNSALAPDVTTNSWLCPPSEGCNATALLMACQAQRMAGIITCVAAGNSGSNCSTVQWPPAIYDEVWSIGAHRHNNGNLAGFSSRGPVTVDGSNRMKPDLTAPGVSVRSSIRGGNYASYQGTSMATPHAAGAVALLLSAYPQLKGQVDVVETIFQATAVPVSDNACSSSGVPNNRWGHGRLDVLAAVNAVYSVTLAPSTANLAATPGSTASYSLVVTNTGYVDDTYSLSSGISQWSVSGLGAVGPLNPGQSQTVTINVSVPATAPISSTDSVVIQLTSYGNGTVFSTATLNTTADPLVPTLTLSQPQGPGGGLVVSNGNLQAGREYFNIFSNEACIGGPGTGPYLGLCATDFLDLYNQFLLPVGLTPFHWIATGPNESFGPYALPAGLSFEGICFDFSGSVIGGISGPSTIVTQ